MPWNKHCVPTYLTKDERESVKRTAKEQGVSVAEFIRHILLLSIDPPESWLNEAEQMGTDVSTMVRHHTDLVIESGVIELPEVAEEIPENVEVLKEENQRLREEIERLESLPKKTEPSIVDRVWEILDFRNFKTEEELLIEIGVLDPLKDGGKRLRELQPDEYLERQIQMKDLEETLAWMIQEANELGYKQQLEYRAKKGWRRLR